ncbi:DUF554 domain-containing protein [Peptoniphilus sp. oral taxon 386]|uniref:DUF554 domain-containing protein n=1 Tax=Peptoniphilus sp. oral taxon 386 TaxID=652713 RepID=UPI0001DA9EDA|nr:DUF554 domain-containing protein [Peptoniphilus sp. oral taxon 386]EFI41520.1 hypothetical protein HMPREF0629_00142 [Peptoniphilus sp. oral taxon 386 str. F0131]
MIAALVNGIAIIICSIFGKFVGGKFRTELQDQLMDILAICIFFIGVSTSLSGENVTLVVLSCIIGVIIGDAIGIEDKLYLFGDKVRNLVMKNRNDTSSKFVEGFITGSILFAMGSMAILGSIAAGVSKNYSVLFAKSIIDGVTAVVLSSMYGIGVLFSGIVVFLYEGAIALFAGSLQSFFTPTIVANISGVGGILIMAIGIDMLKIKEIKTSNMMPAILIPIVYEILLNLIK